MTAMQPATTGSRPELPFWIAGALLGAAAGYIHIRALDLTLPALLVAATSMFLGVARPRKPWRWALLVALCLPAAQLLAFISRVNPTRGEVAASFVALVPAFVGAYGGSLLRQTVHNIFEKAGPPQH
jgi:hypothetical protein